MRSDRSYGESLYHMGWLLRWLSIPVRGNWQWTLVALLVSLALFCAGFSDGGDSWWDGG